MEHKKEKIIKDEIITLRISSENKKLVEGFAEKERMPMALWIRKNILDKIDAEDNQ